MTAQDKDLIYQNHLNNSNNQNYKDVFKKNINDNNRHKNLHKIKSSPFRGNSIHEKFEIPENKWQQLKQWLWDGKQLCANNNKDNNNYSLAIVVEIHLGKIITRTINQKNQINLNTTLVGSIAKKYLITAKKTKKFVCIGDRVILYHNQNPNLKTKDSKDNKLTKTCDNHYLIIHRLFRKNCLYRNDPFYHDRIHLLGANIDQMIIVSSISDPFIDWNLICNYLAFAEINNIHPVIVLSKIDLFNKLVCKNSLEEKNIDKDFDHSNFNLNLSSNNKNKKKTQNTIKKNIVDIINRSQYLKSLNYELYFCSINDQISDKSNNSLNFKTNYLASNLLSQSEPINNQLDDLIKDKIKDKLSIITGLSGVGKSSLINYCKPDFISKVAKSIKHGRHTTSASKLIPLKIGGAVIDTPGIKTYKLNKNSHNEIVQGFKEIMPLIAGCHFKSCTHTIEPNCKVIEAVKDNKIPNWRWQAYKNLLKKYKNHQN